MTANITLSEREQQLVAAMRRVGYRAEIGERNVRLHALPVGRWGTGYELPYLFRSIAAAAEHLVPIVVDEEYREVVCQ